MRYNGKEYTKEPAPVSRLATLLFRAWDDTCTGCAFRDDEDLCRKTCNKDDTNHHKQHKEKSK